MKIACLGSTAGTLSANFDGLGPAALQTAPLVATITH
jgi:hypothetical protein